MTTTNADEIAGTVTAGEQPVGPDVLEHLRNWETKTEGVGRETLEARLDAWQARIQALRIQAHLAGLDARDQAAAPLARMEARLDHSRDRLRELARESADVWTVLVEAYESTRDELAAASSLVQERVTR